VIKERPEIVRRRVDIDFDGLPPLPWRPHTAAELWLKAGSMIFPRGERFFIDSVRACQDSARDPVLRDQIGDFMHQEAMHAKVHTDCNDVLGREYSGARRSAWWTDAIFNTLGYLSRGFRLSVTTGIEHFTAIAAHRAFEFEDQMREAMPEPFVDLWLWHAAEETEHKAVCFDLHRAYVGGGWFGYVHRIAGMLVATVVFGGGILLCAALLRIGPHGDAERRIAKPRHRDDPKRPFEMRSMFRFMGQAIPWRLYFDYFRPSFHPWDDDDAHFVGEWRDRYPRFGLS
jgi:predicted metal-dependent hydrolase